MPCYDFVPIIDPTFQRGCAVRVLPTLLT